MEMLKPLQTQTTIKRLCVIANPVSGTNRSALDTIKTVLQDLSDVEIEICLTEKSGDARRFAQNAAREAVDLVIACGGDGTVMEVAAGLQGSDVPMAILPCGTANVMAVELGVPLGLNEALAL